MSKTLTAVKRKMGEAKAWNWLAEKYADALKNDIIRITVGKRHYTGICWSIIAMDETELISHQTRSKMNRRMLDNKPRHVVDTDWFWWGCSAIGHQARSEFCHHMARLAVSKKKARA
jgi:hypothetical protein